jgi:uncharacterized PurR-regulated membrane protein YhhQ (DUF165 family)
MKNTHHKPNNILFGLTPLTFVLAIITVFFPAAYIFGAIFAESYGWKITMRILWASLLLQICLLLFHIAVPTATSLTMALTATRFGLEKIVQFSDMAGVWQALVGFLNIYLISKWKVLKQGKYFWARSLVSSSICGFVNIFFLATFIPVFLDKVSFSLHLNLVVYLVVIFYTLLFLFPGQLVVNYLKRKKGVDHYDYKTSYNPFNFKK